MKNKIKTEKQQAFMIYATEPIDTVIDAFKSSLSGLSQTEATHRQGQLPKEAKKNHTLVRLFFQELKSPFNVLFLTIGFVSLLVGEQKNALFIILFVTINICISVFQQYKADRSLALLQKYLTNTIKVLRDNTIVEIQTTELVPGDIVYLFPGTIVPADIRLVKTDDCTIDESALTGESVPSHKDAVAPIQTKVTVFNAPTIAFKGTVVVSGKAAGIVVATEQDTVMGSITKLVRETERESDFNTQIIRLSKIIIWQIFISLTLVFIINIYFKPLHTASIFDLFIFLTALAITVIPEALPVVITFTLSRGIISLSKKKVIVKRLSAIEDLGSIEILCTDKTGTITENTLTVTDVFAQDAKKTLFYAALAAEDGFTQRKIHLKGFDQAIWKVLKKEEQEVIKKFKILIELPFDFVRKCNAAIVEHNTAVEYIVRGMPEEVLKNCSHLTHQDKQNILALMQEQGKKGIRTLAIAHTIIEKKAISKKIAPHQLTYLGMIGFTDPLKKTAAQALHNAQKLGVTIKIISGDAPEVCGSLAYQIGLIDEPSKVISGTQFAALSPQQKNKIVHECHVFARIMPEQKYEIIQLLRKDFEVGYAGDGINDAPALKIADVSLVVPQATDIAREAADIVLLDKNLLTIIDAIYEGRRIFSNVLKYVRVAVSTNLGNFYSLAIVSLFVDFLPMLPIQLLTLNLMSDLPFIAISTDHVAPRDIKRKESYHVSDILLFLSLIGMVSSCFDITYFLLFKNNQPSVVQTGWFLLSILTEIVIIFSLRTNRFFLHGSRPSWQLVGLSCIVLLIAFSAPYTSIGQQWLHVTPLPLTYLIKIIFLALIYLFCSESVKLIYLYFRNHTNNKIAQTSQNHR